MNPQWWVTVVTATGWLLASGVARFWWHQASYDQLTGLPGRARLATLAKRTRRRHGSVGLLLLDVDRFKQVNDTYGHRVGDEVLASVAARLRQATRRGEVAIRLHGDEFALWLGPADQTAAARRAGEVAAVLAGPVRVAGHELVVTVSVGHAAGPGREATLSGLLHRADASMYAAKRARSKLPGRPATPATPVSAPASRPRDHRKDAA